MMGMKKLLLVAVVALFCMFAVCAEDVFLSCSVQYLHSNVSDSSGVGANTSAMIFFNLDHSFQPGMFFRGDFGIFHDKVHGSDKTLVLCAGYGLTAGLCVSYTHESGESLCLSFGPGIYSEGRIADSFSCMALFADLSYIRRHVDDYSLVLGASCYTTVTSEPAFIPCVYLGLGI